MKAVARKLLFDARQAATAIQAFCEGHSLESYQQSMLLRSAVERQFEIIGEALSQLSKVDATLAARIPEAAQIISFRNQLIHGYATISNKLVWSVVLDELPGFIEVMEGLLAEGETP